MSDATEMSDVTEQPRFAEHYDRMAPARLPWLADLKAQGIDRYRALGLPTPKVESWKYTNLRRLERIDFRPPAEASEQANGLDRAPAIDGYRAVLVNGRFRRELSDLDLPEGVMVAGLEEALARDPAAIEGHLGRIATLNGQAMLALNTALMRDGIVLKIDAGVQLQKPLHLVSLGADAAEPTAFHPRCLVLAGADSRACLIESHVGVDGQRYFTNLASEISVGEGAALGHYKLQHDGDEAYHLASSHVRLAARAQYDGFVLALGGRLSRNEITAEIAGGGAECRLNGCYMIDGQQHVDNTTFIDHAVAGSRSREVYKGVLDDTARGVFQGKILVRKDAQQTDGHQLNRALLLSRGAEVDSKPELEIYADDVKCSHGATVGELEEDQLFYLMARGIDPKTARDLLIAAFLGEAIEEIRDTAARDAFRDMLTARLEARRTKGES